MLATIVAVQPTGSAWVIVMMLVMRSVLHFLNPCGRRSRLVKIEQAGMEDLVKIHVTVVRFDDLCGRLDGADNGLDARQLVRRHLGDLVEQDHIAELDLFGNKCRKIFLFGNILERLAAIELVTKTESIHYRTDTIEYGQAVLCELRYHLRIRAECLGYRRRFAYTGRLDNDIIERLLRTQIMELGNQIHLERTTYTAVLECHQTVVLLRYHSALLNKRGVDIHFAYVIDNNCKTNTFPVRQNTVEQSRLSAAKVAGN